MQIAWRSRDKVCCDKVEIFIENGKIPIQSGYLGRTKLVYYVLYISDSLGYLVQAYKFNNLVEMEFFNISNDRRHKRQYNKD